MCFFINLKIREILPALLLADMHVCLDEIGEILRSLSLVNMCV